MRKRRCPGYGAVVVATLLAVVVLAACDPSSVRILASPVDWTALAEPSSTTR